MAEIDSKPPARKSKAKQPAKKEKVFHPDSRKAGQLARVQLRKSKLADAHSKRVRKNAATGALDLCLAAQTDAARSGQVRLLLPRHPARGRLLNARRPARARARRLARPPRPRTRPRTRSPPQGTAPERARIRARANKAARVRGVPIGHRCVRSLPPAVRSLTFAEVPDLTHPANVALFRRWDEAEAAYVDLLRFIRISSTKPDQIVVSRPGKHSTLKPKPDPSSMDTSA